MWKAIQFAIGVRNTKPAQICKLRNMWRASVQIEPAWCGDLNVTARPSSVLTTSTGMCKKGMIVFYHLDWLIKYP